MTPGQCAVTDCARPIRTRGWCNMHHQRWWKHGDPLAGATHYTDPAEAFLARTEPIVGDPGCLVWTGALTAWYGHMRVDGRMVLVHRYAWEQVHGPIPDEVLLDHRCHTTSCAEVDHLRTANNAQNTQHLKGPRRGRDLPRGVSRSGSRYIARVRHDGKVHSLGTYDTPEAASEVAHRKRVELFGEFAGKS